MSNFSKHTNLYLSNDKIEFYRKNGYLVLSSFWNHDDVKKIRDRAISLVENAGE